MQSIHYRDLEKQALIQERHLHGKKKVAFVLQSLTTGGAERVLITLMNGLDRTRFEPELIVMDENGSLRDWIAKDIPFHGLGKTRISSGIGKLAKKLNAIEPDIIFSTMAAMNYGVLLAKPLLKKKSKIIIREAAMPSSIVESQRFPWLVKKAYRNLYPQADLIICPARCVMNEFHSFLCMDIGNYELLHNPVDIHKIHSTLRIMPEISKTREKTRHFVCAGRLHYQKGYDRLITALACKRGGNWKLDILGEGKECGMLETLIRKYELEDQITMRGLVKEPWPLIAAADALLLPSRCEGLPNVALESLCVGTPVIAHREAGGILEIADAADKGAVQIVSTMDEMLRHMDQVRPNPTRTFRDTLLPAYFHQNEVIKRFSDLLAGDPQRDINTPVFKRTGILTGAAQTKKAKSFGRRVA